MILLVIENEALILDRQFLATIVNRPPYLTTELSSNQHVPLYLNKEGGIIAWSDIRMIVADGEGVPLMYPHTETF